MPHRFLTLQLTSGSLPPADQVVLGMQRLRGAILAAAVRQLRPAMEQPRYEHLLPEERQFLSGLTGKDGADQPTAGNHHLALLPIADALAPRVIAFRRNGFTEFERIAIFGGSRRLVSWGTDESQSFGVVPVPASGDDIQPLVGPSLTWVSHTPFVPPPHRHRYRSNGKARQGESPERQIAILCAKMGYPVPTQVAITEAAGGVLLHRTLEQRNAPTAARGASRWPGYHVRLEFDTPVEGPIFLGHSCHFGLGLFTATAGDLDRESLP